MVKRNKDIPGLGRVFIAHQDVSLVGTDGVPHVIVRKGERLPWSTAKQLGLVKDSPQLGPPEHKGG